MNSLDESVPSVDAKATTKPDHKSDPKTVPSAGTAGMAGMTGTKTGQPDAAEPSPEQLEIDIEGIRENLGGLISELDHRRHRLNPMRIVRSNPFAIAAGGALVVGLCVGGIAWHTSRTRKAASAVGAGKKFSEATRAKLRQLLLGDVAPPAREARPNVTMKLLTAAGTAVAAVAARRLAEGAFARARAKATPPRGR